MESESESESFSEEEEEGEEEGEVTEDASLPPGSLEEVRKVRLQRSLAEDLQELKAFRDVQDKLLILRDKDKENWYSGPSLSPEQVCFLGFLLF